MKELKMCLEIYLMELKRHDKEFRENYKKENPGHQGFTYDREKLKRLSIKERMIIRNESEQRLHINRLLKLINQIENQLKDNE